MTRAGALRAIRSANRCGERKRREHMGGEHQLVASADRSAGGHDARVVDEDVEPVLVRE